MLKVKLCIISLLAGKEGTSLAGGGVLLLPDMVIAKTFTCGNKWKRGALAGAMR